ncbi:MAG: hypothetical protein HQM14_01865 [SAR324 cluster bacterium]|nr:hypothetical protein [SAR324 cluster bacterium]
MKEQPLIYFLTIGWVLILSCQTAWGTKTVPPPEYQLMKQEYQVMSQMRHKLRELLERQEFEEIFQQSNDVYTSFQNLEQWLQKIEKHNGREEFERMFAALENFEAHIQEILHKQTELAEQFPDSPFSQNMQAIPLADLMKTVKALIKNKQFQEAHELLNRMLTAFDQQQQRLQQSIAQYNKNKFADTLRQLTQLAEHTAQALDREKQIRSQLQDKLKLPQLPQNLRQDIALRQTQVTQLIKEMQQRLQQMDSSPFFSLDQLNLILQQSQSASQRTMKQIPSHSARQVDNAAGFTQVRLNQVQMQLSSLQQQIQQMIQPRRQSRGNQQQYWSEKGVRPPKFEYQFQVDPQYRDHIQQLNQQKQRDFTPRQRQYLQEVIK